MAHVRSSEADFGIFSIDRKQLEHLQATAEERGFATRWSSVERLRSEVGDGPIFLQSLLREERNGEVRAYRCIVVFPPPCAGQPGGATTFDVEPVAYGQMKRVPMTPEARSLTIAMFALALDGIRGVAKG